MKPPIEQLKKNKEGAALLVAIMVLLILGILIGSFAFEANLEARLVSHKRKKWRAEMMALSGLEYAKAMLDEQAQAKQLEIEDMVEDKDDFMKNALFVQRGLTVNTTIPFDDGGQFTITIAPAEAGLNVNTLNRQDWLDIFEMANIPSTDWDAMIDCLTDWIDENDLHGLNGAESDDEFYEEAGYPVKNAPLDSVEELLLIKFWGPDILYGRPADDENDEIFPIYDLLTVWGDGKLNINSASIDALYAAGLTDEQIERLLDLMKDDFGDPNGIGAGIKDISETGLDPNQFKLQSTFVKVTSVGDIFGQQYEIEAIFLMKNKDSVVVYWNEGPAKKNK